MKWKCNFIYARPVNIYAHRTAAGAEEMSCCARVSIMEL